MPGHDEREKARARAKSNSSKQINLTLTRRANQLRFFNFLCPAPFAKIFWFSERQITFITPVVPSHSEGRWPSSRTLGRDAVDAAALLTNSAKADGEVVWS
jgi:hypothetical protein